MVGPGRYGATRSVAGHSGRDCLSGYWPAGDGSNGMGSIDGHMVNTRAPATRNSKISTTGARILLLSLILIMETKR